MLKIISLSVLLLGLTFHSHAADNQCNADDSAQIHTAIINYIDNDFKGASEGATIKSERCQSAYASVIVHYRQEQFDEQIGYLQKVDGQWKVLGLATGFDGEFMDAIPKELQQ